MTPKASIIIANFNGESYLNRCLDAVLKTTFKDFEIILVDDGSTDESLKIIQEYEKKDRRIKILKNEVNLGASASRNKAIKNANGNFLVFLDNDTEVKSNWLTELIKPMEDDKTIGGVQALLLDFKNRDLIQTGGGLLIPYTAWLAPFYQWRKYKDLKPKLKPISIIAVSAALAIRKEVIEKVGGFDEKEAVYTEDLDFCWRIWITGYKIKLAPEAIVYHLSKSVGARANMNASYRKIYYSLAKNSIRSIIKNYQTKNLFKYLLTTIFVNLAREILILARRGDFSGLFVTINALLWNLINLEDTLKQRQKIQNKRVYSDKELFDEIFVKGSLMDIYNNYFKQTKLL